MWKLFISYIVSKNRRALIPLFSYEHIHEKFLPKKERTKKLFNNLSYFCRVARQKKARIYYTSHAEKELYSFRWLYKLLWFTFNKITEIESMCRNIYIFMLLKQNEIAFFKRLWRSTNILPSTFYNAREKTKNFRCGASFFLISVLFGIYLYVRMKTICTE